MPGAIGSEFIFIAAMMILILIISAAAVFLFLRQYRREMAERQQQTRPAKENDSESVKKASENGTSADS